MPRFIHLADIHIGTPFAFLPPEARMTCRNLQLTALKQAVSHASTVGADAILIAGDLFDTAEVPLTLYGETMDILSRACCPVVISTGNHDYLHARSPYHTATTPANVHVFQSACLSPFALPEANTVIWGAAFHNTEAHIPLSAPLDSSKCNVLCLHGDLLANNAYNPIDVTALGQSGFDYAAFGHNHAYCGPKHTGRTTYASAGCLTGTGPSEDQSCGYLVVDIQPSDITLDFVPSAGLCFASLTVDISAIDSDRALGQAIAARIPAAHERTCLALTLSGTRAYTPDLSALQRALSQVCLHASILDGTTRKVDLWQYEAAEDLRGALTRRFRAHYNHATTEEERSNVLYTLQIALAALDGTTLPT